MSLRTQLEESEKARSRAASVADAQFSAAAAREAELSEELLRSRQAAARAACSGEDDVIAMENAMRGKHEREVAELQARATESEQRVRVAVGLGRVGGVEGGGRFPIFGFALDGFGAEECYEFFSPFLCRERR